MNPLLLTLFICICILTALLILKLLDMRRSIRRIRREFSEKLSADTNTQITIASSSPVIKELARDLNRQLKILRKMQIRYQQGDRELKDAVTGISHDLRTPLTAVCGYLSLLEKEDMTPAVRHYLSSIENRIHVLKTLTEELFRYSFLLSSGKYETREPVCLNSSLEEAAAGYYAALTKRGITPCISIPRQKIVRFLNREALSRILGNLMSNALKYSEGDLSISLNEDGIISFSNTAGNFNEVLAGQLFHRFFTVETGQNSTGLGLSIAKMLTEQMGGEISAFWKDKKLHITLSFPSAH